MSYITKSLEIGETIVSKPSISKIAYMGALANFIISFAPFGLLGLAGTELALTNKRIIGRAGRTTMALPHAKIDYVAVRQGILGNLLGYGTVVIGGKDGTTVKFKGIVWPLLFQQEANEAIEVAVLGRKLSEYETAKF